MFKKPTKKQFIIRRVILSVIATVSVFIIVTFSILFMLGYRLDSGNGRLEQGALLQFDSTPDAAQVWIDGSYIGSQTATKQTVLAGNHSIKFTKNGYEDWNRSLNLDAGTLTWLDYARLVPKSRPVEQIAQYSSLVAMKFSPDYKWALAQQAADVPTFEIIDLRAEQVRSSTITLASEVYSEAGTPNVSHTFAIDKWNAGGRYALVKHTFADRSEWIMVDTQDVARSVNISTSLSVDLIDVKFAGTSGMNLYGLTSDAVLRKLDVSAGTISRGLVSNVQSFSVYEENSTVSYVGTNGADPAKPVVGIYKDGDSGARVLRTADAVDTQLKIVISKYFGDEFVAIAENSKIDILTGTLPSASTRESDLRLYATFSLPSSVTALSFSPRGDYVLAQTGEQFTTYEVEHKRSSSGSFETKPNTAPSMLKWLDVAHVWNDDMNAVVMRDFDNSNIHSIMPSAAGFDASISQNGRFFYSVGTAKDGGYQLQRVRMILS